MVKFLRFVVQYNPTIIQIALFEYFCSLLIIWIYFRNNNTTSEFNIKIVNDKRQLIAPIFSPCDSSVSPWLLERGMCPRPLKMDLRLPKLPDLQGICRGAILSVCRSENLSKLGLPMKLVNFLRFKVAAT